MPSRKRIFPVPSSDRVFFQQFYESHKGFFFYIARQYAPIQSDCEDLVQEALMRLMNNIPTLKTLTPNKAAKYIALTVKTAYLDLEKRKYSANEVATEDTLLMRLLDQDALSHDGESISNAILSLKESLPARDWLVLEGKYILGYSQEELAGLIGVSPDSLRMILTRARKKAKEILLSGDENGGDCYD